MGWFDRYPRALVSDGHQVRVFDLMDVGLEPTAIQSVVSSSLEKTSQFTTFDQNQLSGPITVTVVDQESFSCR